MELTAHTVSFTRHRPLLFSVAYRMTGSLYDAEDIVQDVWLRFIRTPIEKIRDEKYFLVRLVTRTAIDSFRKSKREREAYKGVWLPEMVLDEVMHEPHLAYERQDTISYALLHTLERLNPVERAAFLFRDVFDFDYSAIAKILARNESACRKLVSRARNLVKEGKPRFMADKESVDKIMWAFLRSADSGNIQGLQKILADDARLYSDGGGKVKSAILPIRSRRKVARFLVGVAKKRKLNLYIVETLINGETGLLVMRNGLIDKMIHVTMGDCGITTFRIMQNPDKIPLNLKVRLKFRDIGKMFQLFIARLIFVRL